MSKLIGVGETAPSFSLKVNANQTMSLPDFQGKFLILVFYPADWSPVCGDELSVFNEILSEFKKFNAELVGISVDNIWSHLAFTKDRHLHFPLLSDFEPKGKIAKLYGAYNEQTGTCERALFLINPQGKIIWNYLSPMLENPGADGLLEALQKYHQMGGQS